MMTSQISKNKDLLLFEKIFFKKLQSSSNQFLLKEEKKLKKLATLSISKYLEKTRSKKDNLEKKIATLILENENEKKYFGNELHNGLHQVLAALNFYIEAIKHPNNNNKVELKEIYLDKIAKLGQEAVNLSKNFSDNLVFNPLKGKCFKCNLKKLVKDISIKNNISIAIGFDSNFNEILLNQIEKHQIYCTSNEILNHALTKCKPNSLTLKYSFKYRDNILQIDIVMKGTALSKQNLENQATTGYNNLNHKLELIKARLFKKGANRLIVKLPISNKDN